MVKKTGGFAFPSTIGHGHGGMDLRDWFAGQALPELMEGNGPKNAAELAYQYADAMLEKKDGE